MDTLTVRKYIVIRCEFYRRSVRKLIYRLNYTLAEGLFSYNSITVILKHSGEYLGCRRRIAVYKYDYRKFLRMLVLGIIRLKFSVFILYIKEQGLAVISEIILKYLIYHTKRHIHITSAVITEIDDNSVNLLVFGKLIHGCIEILLCRRRKRGYAEIADIGALCQLISYRYLLDGLPLNAKLKFFLASLKLKYHLGTFFARYEIYALVQ